MKVITVLLALLANTLLGGAFAYGFDINPVIAIAAMNVIGFGMSFIPVNGIRAGVYVEVWTKELVKQMSHADTATFLDGIPDYSRYAENDVIHLVDIGADPAVLINNTTYPIPITELPDGDIAISLHKFQTEATPITDDELHALSYDKISSVKERHGNALAENKHDMAIHAMSPASNGANTPVLVTTGADDGTGRRRLVRGDIIRLKDAWDKAKIPVKGRRLVLCSDHVNDLLDQDQKFQNQYYNYDTGMIGKMYGFEVYEYVANPYYNAAGTKLSFGAVPVATDRMASVAFYVPRMFKAVGSTKMYYSKAENDPLTQRNLINFRHYFLVMPKKQEAVGAIVSANI